MSFVECRKEQKMCYYVFYYRVIIFFILKCFNLETNRSGVVIATRITIHIYYFLTSPFNIRFSLFVTLDIFFVPTRYLLYYMLKNSYNVEIILLIIIIVVNNLNLKFRTVVDDIHLELYACGKQYYSHEQRRCKREII